MFWSQPHQKTDKIQVANLEKVVLGQQFVDRPEPHIAGVGVPSYSTVSVGSTSILLGRLAAAAHNTRGRADSDEGILSAPAGEPRRLWNSYKIYFTLLKP